MVFTVVDTGEPCTLSDSICGADLWSIGCLDSIKSVIATVHFSNVSVEQSSLKTKMFFANKILCVIAFIFVQGTVINIKSCLLDLF